MMHDFCAQISMRALGVYLRSIVEKMSVFVPTDSVD